MIALNFVETLAAAGLVLFLGYGIRRVVPVLPGGLLLLGQASESLTSLQLFLGFPRLEPRP